jgi:hypothetical protein
MTYNSKSHFTLIEKSLYDLNFLDKINFDIIDEISENAINHKFKILSSNYIENYHLAKYDGFLGFNYSNNREDHKYNNKLISWRENSFSIENKKWIKMHSNIISDSYALIDWQVDVKSGFRWDELDWYKDITYGNLEGVDIKVPWELGRLQHLIPILISYTKNNNFKYIKEIEHQIIDFYLSNPPRFGCQWTTSMDVSIRAINLLILLDLANSFNVEFSIEFKKIILLSLLDHYEHIETNDEFNFGLRGNHYLVNIATLYIYSLYINELNSLQNKYLQLLIDEINYQFNTDGTNFEASTSYHKFMHELIFLVYNLNKSYHLKENKLIKQKLDSISFFSENLVDSDNSIVQFGDNDSGFILRHNYAESINKAIFFSKRVSSFNSFGDFGLTKYSNQNFDFFIKHNDTLGQNGKGGHNHSDCLDFSLSVDGKYIFINGGTFIYTASKKERNKHRCSEFKNLIDFEYQQLTFEDKTKDDLFWVKSKNFNYKQILINENFFIGEIVFKTFTHRRSVLFNKSSIHFKENLSKIGKYKLKLHLNSDCSIKLIDENELIIKSNNVKVKVTIDKGEYSLNDYDLSLEYGYTIKSKRIEINFESIELNWFVEVIKD